MPTTIATGKDICALNFQTPRLVLVSSPGRPPTVSALRHSYPCLPLQDADELAKTEAEGGQDKHQPANEYDKCAVFLSR